MVDTTPWAPDVYDLLRTTPLRYRFNAGVSVGGSFYPLAVSTATLTLDEEWAPYARAGLTLTPGAGGVPYDALDPRLSPRLIIDAGYVRPDGTEDVHRVADMPITMRDAVPGGTRIEGLSDEIRMMSNRHVTGSFAGGGVREYMVFLLSQAVPGWNLDTTIPNGYKPSVVLPYVGPGKHLLGDEAWRTVPEVTDSAILNFWCDSKGTFHLAVPPELDATGDVDAFRTGPGGVVTDYQDVQSVEPTEGFANVGYARMEREDGTIAIGRAYVSSGPYAVATVGEFATLKDYGRADTGGGHPTQQWIDDAAWRITRGAVSLGQQVTVTAPPHYWIEPGRTVLVNLPGWAGSRRGIVSRVTHVFHQPSMTLQIRFPVAATIENGV